MKPADISVRVDHGLLTITATRAEEPERTAAQYHTCERVLGPLQRSFALPASVEPDKITARFTDGLLEVQVSLPTGGRAAPRGTTIPITS